MAVKAEYRRAMAGETPRVRLVHIRDDQIHRAEPLILLGPGGDHLVPSGAQQLPDPAGQHQVGDDAGDPRHSRRKSRSS
jgi:hypothetical protein